MSNKYLNKFEIISKQIYQMNLRRKVIKKILFVYTIFRILNQIMNNKNKIISLHKKINKIKSLSSEENVNLKIIKKTN